MALRKIIKPSIVFITIFIAHYAEIVEGSTYYEYEDANDPENIALVEQALRRFCLTLDDCRVTFFGRTMDGDKYCVRYTCLMDGDEGRCRLKFKRSWRGYLKVPHRPRCKWFMNVETSVDDKRPVIVVIPF